MERFEAIARQYLNGNDEIKAMILSFFNEEDKKTFLEGVGFYRLFTDKDYYKNVQDYLAERVYSELSA